jgi:hypothetical protein
MAVTLWAPRHAAWVLAIGPLAAATVAARAAGQTPVHGTVVAAESGTPLVAAVVAAVRSRRTVGTDQLGRFRVAIDAFPETLVVMLIGRIPDTVALQSAPDTALYVMLQPSAVPLSAIAVTSTAGVGDASALGRWQYSLREARALPPAIETDVFRALALAPAVTFSTPLSARPLIRGFGAGESSFRIDGHEVLNLYHVGRMFAAFPADATQEVTLTAAPARVTEGGTLAGIVDITGRGGSAQAMDGGADLSLASATAWLGGGGAGARWFGAARVIHFGLIGAITDKQIPYGFQDLYGNLVIGRGARPRARLTVFASRDRLEDADPSTGMNWNNLLLGWRWQLVDHSGWGLAYSASATRFAEDAAAVRARRSRIDVRNRFARIGNSVELTYQGAAFRLMAGGSVGWRTVGNRIVPVSGLDFAPADVDLGQLETAAYAEWSQLVGPVTIQMGSRIDVAGSTYAFQPRGRLEVPVGRHLSVAAGAGRTAQLYHLISDPLSEPDVSFYDFWLPASDSGMPVATADHAALDVDFASGVLHARLSAFVGRARGLVELRPASDLTPADSSQFRLGRGRTRGLEMQVSLSGSTTRRSSVSLAYVYSGSWRNWGGGWVPWALDRRHMVRLLGQLGLGQHWTVFAAAEATTSVPVTPVTQVMFVGIPDATNNAPPRGVAYVYGGENSTRSAGTAHVDIGGRFLFRGPWGSRAVVGVSALNVGFGPVAPTVPADPAYDISDLGPTGRPEVLYVRYERLFSLPAVPTVTFRLEF